MLDAGQFFLGGEGGESNDHSRMYIRNKNFLAGVYKKQIVKIDSPASSGDRRKCFPWPPLEAALQIFNLSTFC